MRDGAPLWLVVALDFRLAPLDGPLEPGGNARPHQPDRRGAVDLDRTQVIESLSRHLLTWIHSWDVDGLRRFWKTGSSAPRAIAVRMPSRRPAVWSKALFWDWTRAATCSSNAMPRPAATPCR
ncbi:MAG: hypothetical protein HPM95_03320 [Alphaproteobacteria bacterium]|nr:hypothetical protein [Alphaproteobacteria bacterium]